PEVPEGEATQFDAGVAPVLSDLFAVAARSTGRAERSVGNGQKAGGLYRSPPTNVSAVSMTTPARLTTCSPSSSARGSLRARSADNAPCATQGWPRSVRASRQRVRVRHPPHLRAPDR